MVPPLTSLILKSLGQQVLIDFRERLVFLETCWGWDFNTAFTGKETDFTIIADGTREPYVMLSTVVCIPKVF